MSNPKDRDKQTPQPVISPETWFPYFETRRAIYRNSLHRFTGFGVKPLYLNSSRQRLGKDEPEPVGL